MPWAHPSVPGPESFLGSSIQRLSVDCVPGAISMSTIGCINIRESFVMRAQLQHRVLTTYDLHPYP